MLNRAALKGTNLPCPSFPCFLGIPCFLSPQGRGIPCFFSRVFPFFSRDSRGSVGIKIPVFDGVFLACFQKKGKDGQGKGTDPNRRPKRENGQQNVIKIFYGIQMF